MDLCITPQTGMDNPISHHGKPVHKPLTSNLIHSATCQQLANSLPTMPDRVTHTGKGGGVIHKSTTPAADGGNLPSY